MSGKKQRSRPHKKAKHAAYISNNTRDKNKSKRIVNNIFKSKDSETTFNKISAKLKDGIKQLVTSGYRRKVSNEG